MKKLSQIVLYPEKKKKRKYVENMGLGTTFPMVHRGCEVCDD